MLDEMRVNDVNLTHKDIRALENPHEIAGLFAKLGYNIDDRTVIPDIGMLGLDSEDLRQQILRLELLAVDPVDEDIRVYFFEVRSVTAKLRNDIARRFKDRTENALLVLTSNYETIDFVLLERVVTKSKSRGKPLSQVIRPIPLHINRLNPDSVRLRVLKRFSFTEEDSAYQWEKMRSAYRLAEWSEEYFNNRALFSDYYLKQRLTDSRLTPEWDDDVLPAAREAYRHIVTARQTFTRQPEQTIRQGLYEPMFGLLGFDYEVSKPGDSAADEPDYNLYSQGDRSKPVAVALTYVWNRNLDDVDTTREPEDGTPDEIPGALVVSVLEKTKVPWVIVTNGKLWRLYSSTASNKATNYYEIDLEEAIAATDQITALKYWWLMFRQQAFTGFLDTLLTESGKYARELGDRLKDRVFVEIFPQFAKGFIAHMRTQGVKEADIDLDVVFTGTMTFLYRMMFILYAESLELLPVSEVPGYGDYSLYRLKRELAEQGGENEANAPNLLRKHYANKSTSMYERLKVLFGAIDQGSADYNMPTYNGGLFSSENDSGRFLVDYAIPDQYLALGLDRLTRDEDDKTKKLVFIDFKSLGVRQLGSIYEGLLEFKLKIAAEALAVTKEKGKEVYQPAKNVRKPLASLAKGDVYLENDKQERKATGSYYTPDYIVKYIVQHTVGPVLERKLSECEPQLRQAQREYREYARLVEARRKALTPSPSPLGRGADDPSTFWNKPEMQQLVDDCLNVRVLDPAMGSGHFLVEVVDFVSNRLIDFLNGWSENPVWAALESIREDILADMERQHVAINADKLTRVALLKRAVLKRCVYGVDLNPMAVELAKVSLWLDAFTLGAPLSFLDHHLKCGNSLIGARVSEVQAALEGQLTLFSQSKFAGVMLAADLMQKVSYLSDNTVAQVQASQNAYRDASDHLAPYKRVLDVYTSRWFGNTPTKGKKSGALFDPTVEFLRRDDTQAWLEDPRSPKNRLPADDYMQAGLVAKTALDAAESKRFFHWELEFPEVFFAPSTPGGQDVKLREDGGFDAVVGNPPYVRQEALDNVTKSSFQSQFAEIYSGVADIYVYFLGKAVSILRPSGYVSYITSGMFRKLKYGKGLRQFLATQTTLISLVDFEFEQPFQDAITYPVVVVIQKRPPQSNDMVNVVLASSDSKIINNQNQNRFPLPISDNDWIFTNTNLTRILHGWDESSPLIEWLNGQINRGVSTGYNDAFVVEQAVRDSIIRKEPSAAKIIKPYMRGNDLHAWYQDENNLWLIFTRRGLNIKLYPEVENHLSKYRSNLEPRPATLSKSANWTGRKAGSYQWYEIQDSVEYYEVFENPRIHSTKVSQSPAFSLLTTPMYAANTSYVLPIKDIQSGLFLTAVLNSGISGYYCRQVFAPKANGYYEVQPERLENLPFPRIDFTTPADEREGLANIIIANYRRGDHADVLHRVQAALGANQTDVVHDVLTFLAQQMIDLNKQKQAEVKRFLGWLEGKLKIAPKKDGSAGIDSLTGKTILQGYLGDYQKGQREVSWQDFYYRLHQNRSRFGAALSSIETEIEREYAASLQALLPIKDRLAKTDALIDRIVYRLYGLTDAEIELIERPQYEQALADAKAAVIADQTITDDEVKLDKIAEGILPAAQRFFERVEPRDVEAALDGELPSWRSLPPEAPTFLLTGDYNLRALPDQMDFSSSVIPYTKAVEVALHRLIFEPFRASHRDLDARNDFLKKFMRGERELTLGSYMIILSSRRETALRAFVQPIIGDLDGLAAMLNDDAMREVRNKAAHEDVISRDEAAQARAWAIGILGKL